MFAGHEPPLSGTGTRRDPRAVTHTGIGDERIIRAVARAHDLTLIVMQRNPRLDVVAGDADAAIADALIDGNSPVAGKIRGMTSWPIRYGLARPTGCAICPATATITSSSWLMRGG